MVVGKEDLKTAGRKVWRNLSLCFLQFTY
jgi:hypothetical protein